MLANWLNSLDADIGRWAASLGQTGEMLLRLVLAALVGALVGLEREMRGRQAGFRTNLLVCLGSAIVMVVSISFADHEWPAGAPLQLDPARIAYGVMTGVGFLGAGTIIHSGANVRGLTTAAALWCMAAIGLAVGFGMYILAAAACLLVLMALWLLDYIETAMPKKHLRQVTVRCGYGPACITAAIRRFRDAGFEINDVSFERSHDLSQIDITLTIGFLRMEQFYRMEQAVSAAEGFELVAARI